MRTSDRLVRIRTLDLMSEIGGQGRNGLASLALRAHGVRLSALCTSVELPTRGFSEGFSERRGKPFGYILL
jgi:hypothetical protein